HYLSFSTSDSHLMRSFFLFTVTPTTQTYTLSLHDALPILIRPPHHAHGTVEIDDGLLEADRGHAHAARARDEQAIFGTPIVSTRSEEHTSELQSRENLVCRLLLEKKKKNNHNKPAQVMNYC